MGGGQMIILRERWLLCIVLVCALFYSYSGACCVAFRGPTVSSQKPDAQPLMQQTQGRSTSFTKNNNIRNDVLSASTSSAAAEMLGSAHPELVAAAESVGRVERTAADNEDGGRSRHLLYPSPFLMTRRSLADDETVPTLMECSSYSTYFYDLFNTTIKSTDWKTGRDDPEQGACSWVIFIVENN
jgi:hypothetical protein